MSKSETEQSPSCKKFAENYASVRNTLLRKANLCMELPQTIIRNPPSNATLEHCFLHSIQRNGFEVNYDLGTGDKDPSSGQQCPFEGTIYGKQFTNKSVQATSVSNENLQIFGIIMIVSFVAFIVLFFLSGTNDFLSYYGYYNFIFLIIAIPLLIIGVVSLIFSFQTGTNVPTKEIIKLTFIYWGLNYYQTSIEKTANTDPNTGEIALGGYHPIQTCLHITIGMEQKGKIDSSELESLATRIIYTISQELHLQPKMWDAITPTDINSVKFLDQRKSNGDLHPLESRFPF